MPITYSTVVLAVAIGVIPVLGWMVFVTREHHINYARSNFLLRVFFWGVLTAILASLAEIYLIESGGGNRLSKFVGELWGGQQNSLLMGSVLSALIVAVVEEVSKGAAIIFTAVKTKLSSVSGGLVIGMVVGLAFGVTENGVYFASALVAERGPDLILIIVLRFLLSTSAHIIYSGAMGLFVAEGLNAKGIGGKAGKYLLALIFPVVTHTFFNVVLSTEYSWFSVCIIVLGFFFLWARFSAAKKIEKRTV